MSQRARATQDLNNLRQIGLGMQMYFNDKDGDLPIITVAPGTGTNATPVIYPKYLPSRKIFQSPFDKRPASETDAAPVSYGINGNMYTAPPGIGGNMIKVVSPSATILMATTSSFMWTPIGTPISPSTFPWTLTRRMMRLSKRPCPSVRSARALSQSRSGARICRRSWHPPFGAARISRGRA